VVAVVSLRDENGFSLIELLLVLMLSLLVLTATLAVFNTSYRSAHTNDARFDSVEVARNALDTEARQLRNLAKRLNNTPVMDTVSSYDIIFQTSDPARTWVRYCLDTTTAPATTSRGRLWSSSLSLPVGATAYPVTAGMRGTCPGTGWTSSEIVSDWITNRIGGRDRALFQYRCTDGTNGCIASSATFDQIVNIAAQTIVDSTPGSQGTEILVASGVYLRNQNQAPVVNFVATPTTSRTVLLNGSGSSDYEGRTLSMWWFKGTMPTSITCDSPVITLNAAGQRELWGGILIGDGITLSHTFPTTDGVVGSLQKIGLVACDPGDRFGSAGVPPAAAIRVAIPN
jgi:prepilin-type N-terminal cleavage/methylation domain-containing protein